MKPKILLSCAAGAVVVGLALWSSYIQGQKSERALQEVRAFVDRPSLNDVILRPPLLDVEPVPNRDAGSCYGAVGDALTRVPLHGTLELAVDPSMHIDQGELYSAWGKAFAALEEAAAATVVSRRAFAEAGYRPTLLRNRIAPIVGTLLVDARLALDDGDHARVVDRWGQILTFLVDAQWLGDTDFDREATREVRAAVRWLDEERLARLPRDQQERLCDVLARMRAAIPGLHVRYLEELRSATRRTRDSQALLPMVEAIRRLEAATGPDEYATATVEIDHMFGGSWDFVGRMRERRDLEAALLAVETSLAFRLGRELPAVPGWLRDAITLQPTETGLEIRLEDSAGEVETRSVVRNR